MPLSRHPCEYFAKFLITSPSTQTYDDAWVRWNIASLGYPPPELDYLAALRAETLQDQPADFRPTDRYHRASTRFLRDQGIWSQHNPDDAVREANLLVTDFKPRGLVEQLLLANIDPKEIAKKVNARCGTHLTQAGIESYRHSYWNVHICKLVDWERCLRNFDTSTASKALSIIKVGPAMALHQAGFSQSIESKTMLRNIQEGLYFDFLEWKSQPMSPERTAAMVSVAKAVCSTDTQLQAADTALRDSLKAFEQFRMQHAENDTPGVAEIAPAGNYSLSGAKLLESGPRK